MSRRAKEMLARIKPLDAWLAELTDEEVEDIKRVHGCSPAELYEKTVTALSSPTVDEMIFGPDGKLEAIRYHE